MKTPTERRFGVCIQIYHLTFSVYPGMKETSVSAERILAPFVGFQYHLTMHCYQFGHLCLKGTSSFIHRQFTSCPKILYFTCDSMPTKASAWQCCRESPRTLLMGEKVTCQLYKQNWCLVIPIFPQWQYFIFLPVENHNLLTQGTSQENLAFDNFVYSPLTSFFFKLC